MGNEDSIKSIGFQVSRCSSGGKNYGTWFAYNAAYSDSGYAFSDQEGVRHLFVCVVCYAEVVRDDAVMRVVGQGCAYPMWLLKYKRPVPPPLPLRAITPSNSALLRKADETPWIRRPKPAQRRKRKKHRVHGGCWEGLLVSVVQNGR